MCKLDVFVYVCVRKIHFTLHHTALLASCQVPSRSVLFDGNVDVSKPEQCFTGSNASPPFPATLRGLISRPLELHIRIVTSSPASKRQQVRNASLSLLLPANTHPVNSNWVGCPASISMLRLSRGAKLEPDGTPPYDSKALNLNPVREGFRV